MKSKILLAAFLVTASFSQIHSQDVHVSVGFQTFYDELQPYGTWVNSPQHGYVWSYRPSSGQFKPYSTNGRWVYTDDGWTWVSDYNWGWAPFHYGRWVYDNELGWLWVPGNEWAPAWVTWGSYNGNFAWAPIGPGISISIGTSYRPPANYWEVCPGNYFGRRDWHDHAIRSNDRVTIVNKVTIINNYHTSQSGRGPGYFRGPDTRDVERYTKSPVQHVKITEAARPGGDRLQNNQVALYRPRVNDDRKNSVKPPMPKRAEDPVQAKKEMPVGGRVGNPQSGNPEPRVHGTPVQPQHQPNPGDMRKPLEPNKMPQRQDPVKPVQPQPAQPQHPVDRPQHQPRPVPVTPPANTPAPQRPAHQPRQDRPVQPPQNQPVQPRPQPHPQPQPRPQNPVKPPEHIEHPNHP
jgi:hypothetical protein